MGYVLVVGKPGAGKSTRISEFLKGREEEYEVLAFGQLLREAINLKTEIGFQAKQFVESGMLVSDKIIMQLISENSSSKKTIILDGFPRRVTQARLALEYNLPIDKIIEICIPDDVSIGRLSARVVCKECGKAYSSYSYEPNFSVPKEAGMCDYCKGKLIRRNDDDDKYVVRKRLREYGNTTLPAIDMLKNAGVKFISIDGTDEHASEIFEDVMLH